MRMTTTVQKPQTAEKPRKKAYAPPRVRSEKMLVPDLFSPTGWPPDNCVPDPETGAC